MLWTIIGTVIGIGIIILGIYLMVLSLINMDAICGPDSDDFDPIAGGFGFFGIALMIGFGLFLLNSIWHLW